MLMRRLLLMLVLVVLAIGQILAQQRTITGKITDESGNPISGASVIVKGSSRGVVTGPNGNFSLVVPANASTLTISYVGYESQNVTITGNALDVKLKVGTNPLDEVVVVGYQTRR